MFRSELARFFRSNISVMNWLLRGVGLALFALASSALSGNATGAVQQDQPAPPSESQKTETQPQAEPTAPEAQLERVREAMRLSAGIGLPGSTPPGDASDTASLDSESLDTANQTTAPKVPQPVSHYLGREIAQTMSYHGGAEWLIREEREREERCSMMLVNLGIRPGMNICDMGCGVGFYTIPLAQLTGENGYVAAVDVQAEMLVALRERTEQLGIENVIPILGSYHDPRLPPEMLDIVLMVDVYHEFSHPEPMLGAIREGLKPDGQIVLLEYRLEDPDVPIKRLHKMSKEQIDKEMVANGFKLTKEFDDLPWQHMMFYGKDPAFDEAPNEGLPDGEKPSRD